MSEALTDGVHHIGLAVRDLDEAASFFCGVLGFWERGRNDDYPALFISDGKVILTLWQVADPAHSAAFDRRANIGLHHLALAVRDRAALDLVHDQVRTHPGVTVEFAPGPTKPGSDTQHMICAAAGGIRIEFTTR
jgi:catechol 2,3-dioxygenase-like lactoylglutathione lyase family enzyme